MLQKSVILCVTSVSWLRNALVAFRSRRWFMGTSTSVCSFASLNLWRNYNQNSLRRTVDVAVARLTGVYYALLYVRRFNRLGTADRVRDVVYVVFTNTCYVLSCVVCCKSDDIALFFHTCFHVGVYHVQSNLLNSIKGLDPKT